jgi:hypothetical protein
LTVINLPEGFAGPRTWNERAEALRFADAIRL